MRIPSKEQLIYWSSIAYDIHVAKKSIHVLGYPKTGTNWMCNLLSSYYNIPVLESWNENLPILSQRIYHLHRFYHSDKVKDRLIYMVRDGRDAIISRYFMVMNVEREANTRIKKRFEKYCGMEMTNENLVKALPMFIKFFFEVEKSGSINYSDHIKAALDKKLYLVKYEDLLNDKENVLSNCIKFLDKTDTVDFGKVRKALEANDFKKLKEKKKQNDSVFLRKGKAGDWKNYFNEHSLEVYNSYTKDLNLY